MNSFSVPIAREEIDIAKILKEYGDSILRLCFLYLKDMHLAEDAAQDTFIKVYKNWSKFNGSCSEKTWITRIAINTCKNYLRSPWKKQIDGESLLANIICEDEVKADDTLIMEIMKLSPKYREVILLFYYQEFKIKEIAEILKLPQSTVSVRLKRAREKLKPVLKGWYYDEE